MADSTPQRTPAGITEAVSLLGRRVPGLVAVYLYGSHAKGLEREDSDVDLAVLGDGPAPGPYLLDIAVPYQEHVLPMIPSGMTVRDLIRE